MARVIGFKVFLRAMAARKQSASIAKDEVADAKSMLHLISHGCLLSVSGCFHR
jgi:hypothetical protein